MIRKFRNKITALFIGSLTMVFTACYGTPIEMQESSLQTVNIENEPIPGLKVTYTHLNTEVKSDFTNENGRVYIKPGKFDSVKITDIDGIDNGKYKDTTVILNITEQQIVVKMMNSAKK